MGLSRFASSRGASPGGGGTHDGDEFFPAACPTAAIAELHRLNNALIERGERRGRRLHGGGRVNRRNGDSPEYGKGKNEGAHDRWPPFRLVGADVIRQRGASMAALRVPDIVRQRR